MNKRASFSYLAIAVIIIILLVMFVILLAKFKSQSLQMLEDSECKGSIANHVMLLKSTGEAAVTDIYCPTKYYTIPKASDKEINHYLAEAMKTCWSTWGKGELRLFEGEGYFCHICSVIDFQDKTNKVSGFNQYLLSTPVNEGTNQSYFEYFTVYSSEKALQLLNDGLIKMNYSDVIDTSKSYAAIFLYIKGESQLKSFFDNMDILGLGTGGGGAYTGFLFGVGGAVLAVATGGISAVVIGAFILIETGVGVVSGIEASDDVAWISTIGLIPYDAQSMNEIGCKITPVRQEKKSAVT